jgi:hypothetical protein
MPNASSRQERTYFNERIRPVSSSRYAARMMLRQLALALLPFVLGCQLPGERPAEEPKSKPPIAEAGPLPPEETPSEESAAPAPAVEARPVEPGISSTSGAPRRGKLPPAVVDEKLKSAGPAVQACYEQGLKAKPELRGEVNINLVVGEDGKVAHVESAPSEDALPDATVVGCIVDVLKKLEFPAPAGGRVFLSYPLKLEPPKPASAPSGK